jgi:flagellar secretion chaperone FliS
MVTGRAEMLNGLIDDSLTATGTACVRDESVAHVEALDQRYQAQVGALETLKLRMTTTTTFMTQQLARLQRTKKPTGGRSVNAKVEHALKAHARTRVVTGVAPATPQRLVVMLHDGAVKAAAAAKTALTQGNVRARSTSICKAISIIERGLRPALRVNTDSDAAADLMVLYGYIVNRLLYANLRKHAASLDEVVHLLQELREAWETLEGTGGAVGEERLQPQRARGIALSHGRV